MLTFYAEVGRVVGEECIMSGFLDFKYLRAIVKIRSILSDNVEFKIGKTDDWKRREREYLNDGYTNFYIIAECTNLEEVNNLEKGLISHFKRRTACRNENDGGRLSESEKYYIYLVTK